jgi:hypothetical protein
MISFEKGLKTKDISNQQDVTVFVLFIDLFESSLHVSGDKLAHLQEHF